MLPFAGAVVVWSGNAPRLDTYRIPRAGFALGREHADRADDRIGGEHVRLFAIVDDRIAIEDAGSRDGTYVNGARIASVQQWALPAVVRAGHTIAVLVADVRPYEGVTITRRGKLPCAASLATACRILDRSARDEEHLGLLGSIHVGRALAHDYADTVGGNRVVVDLNVTKLATIEEKLAGAAPRTMILEFARPLTLPDQPELEAWLETDVRIVSVARDLDAFKFMPKELTRRLTPRAIELPHYRFDELPTTFADMLAARAPTATLHATFVESALLQLRSTSEESLLRFVAATIERWVERGGESVLRGRELDEHIAQDAANHRCYELPRLGR